MLKIVSVIDCAIPAARSAANDEPYSTMRRSCSMPPDEVRDVVHVRPGAGHDRRETDGRERREDGRRAPVAPCLLGQKRKGRRTTALDLRARTRRASSRRRRLGRSSCPSLRERAQPCVPLGLAAAEAGCEHGQRERFEVANGRDEGEPRGENCRASDERRRSAWCATVAQRAANDLRRSDCAGEPARGAAYEIAPSRPAARCRRP